MKLLPLLLLAASLLPTSLHAELPALSPGVARYKVVVNGVPAGASATVSIRPLAEKPGRHEVAFMVRNRFFSHREISRFDWRDCQVTAREYQHDFNGLGIERQSALLFDQVRHIAIETRGKRQIEMPLESDMTDALNMAMLSRCRLRDGLKNFSLSVIYRGERKDYNFTVTGHETVSTPAGTWDTLVVSREYPQGGRRTRVWVAPELDWFMVRFEHVENPVARGSLLLTEWTPGLPAEAAEAVTTARTRSRPPRTEKTDP